MPDFFPPCLTLGYVRRCRARSVKVPLSLAKSGNVRHRVVGTVQNCMFTIIQAQCLTYSTNRFPLPYVFFNGLVRTAILMSCEDGSFCPRLYRSKESILSHKRSPPQERPRHFPTYPDISRHLPTFPDISRHLPTVGIGRDLSGSPLEETYDGPKYNKIFEILFRQSRLEVWV